MIQYQDVEGTKIAYWTRPFQSSLRNLVFIHGSGADHTSWIHQYTQFKGEFNIVAVDLPGHGRSGGKGEKDINVYTEWVRKFLDVIGMKKPVLIGHSLGAAICLTFAIKYGADLSAIVPVGGGAKMPVNPLVFEGLKKDPTAVIALAAKFSLAKKHREQYSKLLVERLSNVSPKLLHGDFYACDHFDLATKLSSLKLPTLIICGEEDKMTPRALSEYLRDNVSGAQANFIEDAGHYVMMENIEAFNTVLKKFLLSLH
jgi:pimeloyl-ACP methyl ester carboxylesterase